MARSAVPFVFQSASQDCVPACVLAIARHYQVSVGIRDLRRALVSDPDHGTPLKNLYGLTPWFQVETGRLTTSDELNRYTPCILFLAHEHAVVVWGSTQDGKRLVVGDPAVGLVEMQIQDLWDAWEGITVVLRPLKDDSVVCAPQVAGSGWDRWLRLSDMRSLGVNWWSMAWTGMVATLLGATNAAYAFYFPSVLREYTQFVVFVLSYAAVAGALSWVNNLVQYRMSLNYQRKLALRIDDALKVLELHFYTMGDISTRYQDASTIIATMMGLFRDIPYAVVLCTASVYFLAKISWLLVVFVVAFLVLVIAVVSPLVRIIQQMVYKIRLKQAEVTNSIRNWLSGGENRVTSAYMEAIQVQYRQALWSIPISSILGNSVAVPVLFVVIFMHWRLGGASTASTAGYAELLSGIMMMGYAVSAGHSLYGKIVAWQMALPSLHRLRDFLGIDDEPSVSSQTAARRGELS